MNNQTTEQIAFSEATANDAIEVYEFLQPFVQTQQLLARSIEEILHLTKHAFLARCGGRLVGFAAVEVYSRKLAEIQCLAVSPDYQRMGIGRGLLLRCVARGKALNVLELLTISASDEFLNRCGFDYSLPS
ncbi:MAG TPA: GNAT family N-acetyltransferase, partial [Pirellulaceae bacterium]|nr:GNAT family N-acetyltransferase [Pirellulaceae bacterium]